MNNFDFQIAIVGAGVIGLAIAERLSHKYERIAVIERNERFGEETSSRNSEVIHSGIYYPTGSLKAQLCVKGRDMLYELCRAKNIPYLKCGKLIVATSEEEVSELHKLMHKASENNVNDLKLLSQEEAHEKEPYIKAISAIHSPSTGIIDSHALMHYLFNEGIKRDVDYVFNTAVTGIEKIKHGYKITTQEKSHESFSFTSEMVINTAGLESDKIANLVGIDDSSYKIHFCKGDYFHVAPPKNKLVRGLVYPVPFKKLVGLGVHATIDLASGVRLGPNATYLSENVYDYKVDESKAEEFLISARRFMPFLEKEDLQPDYSGIRPKIQAPGEPVKDFIIVNESKRGYKNFINLIGIESPGLTCSLAIAELVEEIILD